MRGRVHIFFGVLNCTVRPWWVYFVGVEALYSETMVGIFFWCTELYSETMVGIFCWCGGILVASAKKWSAHMLAVHMFGCFLTCISLA